MQSRPGDLADDAVAVAVSGAWRLPPVTASYLPVGYGSHHWVLEDGTGRRWFASVDVLAPRDPQDGFDRLAAALSLAVRARDAGLAFVVAPLPASDGGLVRLLPGGYALSVYPFVSGRSGSFYDELGGTDAAELTAMLCALHGVDVGTHGGAAGRVGVETFEVPGRDRLEASLAEVDGEDGWPGPYGVRLRALLRRHAGSVTRALRRHDRLVAASGAQRDRMVLTHGEPHPGNIIRTPEGLRLIDWDTALLAPPERDVWLVAARTGGRAVDEYSARTGRPLAPELLERYAIAWALADIAAFVDLLGHAAEENADTSWSWDALVGTLDELAVVPAGHRP